MKQKKTKTWYEMSYYQNKPLSTAQRLRMEKYGNLNPMMSKFYLESDEDDYSEESYA